MGSAENKAVFLSYASQDAEAAARICAALRATGVEVWFDQNELVGGDAWDQKIRRQIKECALFVPVISANTNARAEGYFRLEWKLAVDRSHLMADDAPFLFPVVIDDTPDATARVPDRFREVQWTRLNVKDTPETLALRVALLLGGATAPERRAPAGGTAPPPAAAPRRPSNWLRTVAVIGGLAVALVYALRPLWSPPRGADLKPRATGGTPADPAAASVAWPRDPDLRRAMALVGGFEANSEDFALAEDMAKKVLARNEVDPEAVTVMARVQVAFLFRGFDRSEDRRTTARRYAERAVQLAPQDPEALAALGIFNYVRGGDLARAQELLNRAVALKPSEPLFRRFRDDALFADPKVPAATAIASAEQTALDFPGDLLAHYELARHYRDMGRITDMERELDRSIAIQPIANSVVWKSRIALWVRGDLAEMKALIDGVSPRVRGLERVVISRWVYAMAANQPEEGLDALRSLASGWIEDFDYVGPKSLLTAQLLELQGKPSLARLQYEAALQEVRERQARTPGEAVLRILEVWIQHGLGQDAGARLVNRTALETVRRPYRYGTLSDWWFTPVPCALLIGDPATALQLLREAVTEREGGAGIRRAQGDVLNLGFGAKSGAEARDALRRRFQFDPRMAPFRADPEITALLAEPVAQTAAAPLSEGAQLAARALALFTKVGFTRDDLAPAEDLARRATEIEPDSAAAWGARAGVQAAWLLRSWDVTVKRRQETQAFANRALALDPNEPEALLALGHVLLSQGAFEQAEAHLRRSIAAHPSHVRLARALGWGLGTYGRKSEARVVLAEAARHAPRDPLLRYEWAMAYASYGTGGVTPEDLAGALEQLDLAIAIQPYSSALILKAALLAGWRGDLAAMRAALDAQEAMPLAQRSEDRSVCIAMWAGLLERRPDRVEAAAALTARSYVDDLVMPLRPKAWSLALAHRQAGKENLARSDWQAAEAVLRERLQSDPGNERYRVELAITLAWLDRREEAARLVDPIEPVWKERAPYWGSPLILRYYAALGDTAKAMPYLRQELDGWVFTTRKVLPLDPWWDKLRGQPEFEALLQEKGAKP